MPAPQRHPTAGSQLLRSARASVSALMLAASRALRALKPAPQKFPMAWSWLPTRAERQWSSSLDHAPVLSVRGVGERQR